MLVHAETIPLGIFAYGLWAVFLKFSTRTGRAAFQIARLPDGDTVLQGGFLPGTLSIH